MNLFDLREECHLRHFLLDWKQAIHHHPVAPEALLLDPVAIQRFPSPIPGLTDRVSVSARPALRRCHDQRLDAVDWPRVVSLCVVRVEEIIPVLAWTDPGVDDDLPLQEACQELVDLISVGQVGVHPGADRLCEFRDTAAVDGCTCVIQKRLEGRIVQFSQRENVFGPVCRRHAEVPVVELSCLRGLTCRPQLVAATGHDQRHADESLLTIDHIRPGDVTVVELG